MEAAGKYQRSGNEIRMPLNLTIAHAVCDGYHAGQFFERLQQEMDVYFACIFDNRRSMRENETQSELYEENMKLYDRVFVMKDGRIVEEGRWEDLRRRRGFFYELTCEK